MRTIGKAELHHMDCMELDADYFAAACKRIEQASKQERLFA